MPPVTGILETCIYAADLAVTRDFYSQLFGFPILVEDSRICVFAVTRESVLILFQQGATLETASFPGGVIPAHDGSGPVHFAFQIPAAFLDAWREELARHEIPVESEVVWPLGGTSLYFRDPDEHLVELATPGLWNFDQAFGTAPG